MPGTVSNLADLFTAKQHKSYGTVADSFRLRLYRTYTRSKPCIYTYIHTHMRRRISFLFEQYSSLRSERKRERERRTIVEPGHLGYEERPPTHRLNRGEGESRIRREPTQRNERVSGTRTRGGFSGRRYTHAMPHGGFCGGILASAPGAKAAP